MAHWEEVFPQKRPLERGDWLESTGAKDRKGQPVSCFLKTGIPKPTKESVILLCPFGDFEAQFARHSGADLALLANYVSEFFSIKTEVIPPVSKEVMSKIKSRNHGGRHQLLTTDCHDVLVKIFKTYPGKAYCIVGVSMEDLYPRPDWNFVFGQADWTTRTGIFSFCRYLPDDEEKGSPEKKRQLFLRRCFRVITHEIGHLYGICHCVYFECLMNGSNHLDESDRNPLYLCPVDLCKLNHAQELDIEARQRALLRFYGKNGFQSDEKW
eukprot:CAMPEP_0201492034 /NCGR_PEP_ID=MMETSP0151_2-20130828/32037_1 /ASSEMBLY_ACC=CAM_ASM_000257 /TAXON_ID=200890 /ORGANISM="Paramoeba atlantica, Strain 621/1 / CCAP 1560/9" /LENGTH=267 /DNA_ID=CAMNT_0047878683 /DNA_START=145 /DNA_END=945 /DNA_ORIENTATION=+